MVTVCYNNRGEETSPDDKYIFAKKIEDDRGSVFFAFMTRTGQFYDPNGMYNVPNEHTKKQNGQPVYELRKVSATTFQHYITYLKTRNKQWLTQANRDSING